MFELFILYKLSDIRDELRTPTDLQTHLLFFGVAAQLLIWPISLYVWIKSVAKKKILAPTITGAIVALALIPDWTNYLLIGILAMFLRTLFISQIISESDDA